jgi:hypothetical protein
LISSDTNDNDDNELNYVDYYVSDVDDDNDDVIMISWCSYHCNGMRVQEQIQTLINVCTWVDR